MLSDNDRTVRREGKSGVTPLFLVTGKFGRLGRNLLGAGLLLTACVASPQSATLSSSAGSSSADADEARLVPGDLLGKRIFEDPGLSEPPGVACASCHEATSAYRGNNGSTIPAIAKGSRAEVFGVRKTPSLGYMAYSPDFSFASLPNDVTGKLETVPVGGQFWDGRAVDQERQVEGPLFNPREMNLPDKAEFIRRVRASPYASLAQAVYGDTVFDDAKAFEKLASAVAGYEASPRFKPFTSKFDDWLEGRATFTEEERRGYQAFIDPKRGNCLSCHAGGESSEHEEKTTGQKSPLSRNPRNWLFTDFTYDVLGAPRNPAIPDNADPTHFDLGFCQRPDADSIAPPDVNVASLCGAFKTPSLRNVAVAGPYFHNGALATLRDAVAFYFTRDTNPERWYPRNANGDVAKFNDLPPEFWKNVNVEQPPYNRKSGETAVELDQEIDDIVAFLKTLTDKSFAR